MVVPPHLHDGFSGASPNPASSTAVGRMFSRTVPDCVWFGLRVTIVSDPGLLLIAEN